MTEIMKYPMKTNTEKPLFNYLVRDNMEFNYYLFEEFDKALKHAEKMSISGEARLVLIYENYFDTKKREWRGQNTFKVLEGEVIYDKHARVDLHLEFYVNAGEWLNPNKEWLEILNSNKEKQNHG